MAGFEAARALDAESGGGGLRAAHVAAWDTLWQGGLEVERWLGMTCHIRIVSLFTTKSKRS